MPRRHSSELAPLVVLSIGITGGIFSGLLGIGGGTVMVPMLVFLGGLSQRQAHATSLAAMILIAMGALVVYGGAGKVDLVAAGALLPGAVVGARVGASVLSRASETGLKTAFGTFLILAATLLVIKP